MISKFFIEPALNLVGVANNLHMQTGVVLLIALAAKNAILIVEYARNLRGAGGARFWTPPSRPRACASGRSS